MSTKQKWLSDDREFTIQIGKRVLKRAVKENGKIPIYSANVKGIFGYVDSSFLEDFSRDSVLWGIDGDWMVNFVQRNISFIQLIIVVF